MKKYNKSQKEIESIIILNKHKLLKERRKGRRNEKCGQKAEQQSSEVSGE